MYDLASMSCDYVLTGHTEIVLCVDTCVSSSGRTLIVSGSKDKSVSFFSLSFFPLHFSLFASGIWTFNSICSLVQIYSYFHFISYFVKSLI